jgi:hypothetical protein
MSNYLFNLFAHQPSPAKGQHNKINNKLNKLYMKGSCMWERSKALGVKTQIPNYGA